MHGRAPLCAVYLAAAGLGCLRVTGEPPEPAAHDAAFRLERGRPGDPADVVLDLGDGAAFRAARGPALWGCARGDAIRLGRTPPDLEGPPPAPAAQAVLETLAATEALLILAGCDAGRTFDLRL